MIGAFLLLCVGAILLWVIFKKVKGEPVDTDVPIYSKSLPIIGITYLSVFGSALKDSWGFIKNHSEEATRKGGVVKSSVLFDNYYFITDPEDALTIANECLDKHFVYDFVEGFFGQSLFGLPVPQWKVHRKLLNPAFSLPMIHGFIECFNDQAKELVDELRPFAGKGPFKATKYIQNNILRGTCLTTVGDSNKFHKDTITQYSGAINEISNILTGRLKKIWLHSDLIYKLSGQKKIQDVYIDTLTNCSNEIIMKTKMAMKSQENNFLERQVGCTTFLDKYLEINANNALTDRELREELYFIIAASYDTTKFTFECILNIIGSHPEIQERVFEEVMLVVGQEKNIDKENLKKLVYTEAVIKETLRLLPPVPIVARSIKNNVKLKNYTLREKSYVVISLYGINTHTSWGPDADQFRPERWLEPGGVPNIQMASFSIGKRNCIGQTYALTALKIYLAHFIRKYRIEADFTKVELKWEVILKPTEGQEISLNLRNTS